jgi:hypothetical protein
VTADTTCGKLPGTVTRQGRDVVKAWRGWQNTGRNKKINDPWSIQTMGRV